MWHMVFTSVLVKLALVYVRMPGLREVCDYVSKLVKWFKVETSLGNVGSLRILQRIGFFSIGEEENLSQSITRGTILNLQ